MNISFATKPQFYFSAERHRAFPWRIWEIRDSVCMSLQVHNTWEILHKKWEIQRTSNSAQLGCFNTTLKIYPACKAMGLWRPDTTAVGLLRTQAFRQKSWDSLNIHGSKTWFYSVFWAMHGTALKTWGESWIIIAIQAPLFSFLNLTWLGKALLSPLSFQSDSNKTGCVLFARLGDSKNNPCITCATKIWTAMLLMKSIWAFFPQFHLLLQHYYT